MKKIGVVLVLLLLIPSLVFASDFKFLFTELGQHVEILAGFLPTLTSVGVGYEGLNLVDGNLTQLQFTVGGGYTQRKVFQNPKTGAPLLGDLLVYDAIQGRCNLKFTQGFGDSWVENTDLVTLYAGYECRLERNVTSMVYGTGTTYRLNGAGSTTVDDDTSPNDGLSPIPDINNWNSADWNASDLDDSSVYPDLNKDDNGTRSIVANAFYAGAKFNYMEDTGTSSDGFKADLSMKVSPLGLSTDNIAYYSANLNVVGGTTLFQMEDKQENNIFSIVAIDRFAINYSDELGTGNIPVYAQEGVSLGRRVRGFNTASFNTNFNFVNNFDVRLSGPDEMLSFLRGVFVRVNFFYDIGYHSGEYFNSTIDGSDWLSSTGAQFTVSFFDFIDLGLQLSYLIEGQNTCQPNNRLIKGATFFLDF